MVDFNSQFLRGLHQSRPDERVRHTGSRVITRALVFLGVSLAQLGALLEVSCPEQMWRWKAGRNEPSSKYLRKLVMEVIDVGLHREKEADARLKAAVGLMCKDCTRAHNALQYEQLAAAAKTIRDKKREMLEAIGRNG